MILLNASRLQRVANSWDCRYRFIYVEILSRVSQVVGAFLRPL